MRRWRRYNRRGGIYKRSHRYTDTLKSFADNKALYQRASAEPRQRQRASAASLSRVAELALQSITQSIAGVRGADSRRSSLRSSIELANESTTRRRSTRTTRQGAENARHQA